MGNKKEYIIGFRVAENTFWNRLFPLTDYDAVIEAKEDELEIRYKIKKAIDKMILNSEKGSKKK